MIKRYALYDVPDGTADVVLYTDHIAEVCKLRDKLMECAKECSECNGTGVITLNFRTFGKVIHEDCPACHDIRSVLA